MHTLPARKLRFEPGHDFSRDPYHHRVMDIVLSFNVPDDTHEARDGNQIEVRVDRPAPGGSVFQHRKLIGLGRVHLRKHEPGRLGDFLGRKRYVLQNGHAGQRLGQPGAH